MNLLLAIAIGLTAIASPQQTRSGSLPADETPYFVSRANRLDMATHWVRVDLSEQTLTAYAGRFPVRTFVVSTGDAEHRTLPGSYTIKNKYDKIDVIGQDYYFRDVQYYMQYFYGFAIHSATWHNNFGTPVSHGCVNMRVGEAAWLFDFLAVGDRVIIVK